MSDMFGQDDECRWRNDQYGIDVENRLVKAWDLKPRGVCYGRKIDHAKEKCKDIAADDAEEHWYNGKEAFESNRAYDSYRKRK